MAFQFTNPILAGDDLARPSMQSPNFVHGVSGWTINKNGSVEFNSGVFRGTITAGEFDGTDFIINSSGLFFYSGTPALGNLIASIAPASGTDSFGNAYKAGIVSYDVVAKLFAQLFGHNVILGSTNPSTVVTSSALVHMVDALAANQNPSVQLTSPSTSAPNISNLFLGSESPDLTVKAVATLASQLVILQAAQILLQTSPANPLTSALLEVQGAIQTTGINPITGGGGLSAGVGNVDIPTASGGLRIKEGTNARMGLAILSGGTVTVANTSVTANTRVFVNHHSVGTNAGHLGYSTNPGVSFTITSTNTSDANGIVWLLIEAL